MEAKIFVIEFPSFEEVVERIDSLFDSAFECPTKKDERKVRIEEPCDFTPRRFKVKDAFGKAPKNGWGVCGTPADENLRFGYQGPCIDEPRCEDYDKRWQFESDHRAFDRYVEAGEDCIARGLEKKSDAPIHRCNAIRKPVNCQPPMRDEVPGELIGETHWWDEPEWF